MFRGKQRRGIRIDFVHRQEIQSTHGIIHPQGSHMPTLAGDELTFTASGGPKDDSPSGVSKGCLRSIHTRTSHSRLLEDYEQSIHTH